ncbi:hypothetical protein PHYSODRAFT_305569 [Phytophthora sojae]|uniref:Uncharacterized protein n=1 Tax=Phytophthora sojae (strain P6497) TaxID=1094619 RepID=G5A5N0_PHYSP|nr:hypothetical protein PHYSODRAFT_305569 [Phytophthora sojae]EGZ08635.1 hypothetical protein PHYSODRAFT_305569 [Phytophthora sojae]|eukprot:XP_009535268.1 hypothetical protein PHYSODRAFT_305569 [Phytophthora sojae]
MLAHVDSEVPIQIEIKPSILSSKSSASSSTCNSLGDVLSDTDRVPQSSELSTTGNPSASRATQPLSVSSAFIEVFTVDVLPFDFRVVGEALMASNFQSDEEKDIQVPTMLAGVERWVSFERAMKIESEKPLGRWAIGLHQSRSDTCRLETLTTILDISRFQYARYPS